MTKSLAYLGPPGTFTHAGVDLLRATGPVRSEPMPSVVDVIDAVSAGRYDLGLVPVESSVEGDVTDSLDALVFAPTGCYLREEVVVPVRFDLLAVPGHGPLRRVLSHPTALAQCRRVVAERGLETVSTSSTAEACRLVAERREPSLAALASAKAGGLHSLHTVAAAVEDHPGATTRMALLGRTMRAPTGADKTTVVVTPPDDRTGILRAILGCFAARDVALSAVSSRPLRSRLGAYCFVLTARGHVSDAVLRDALDDVLHRGCRVKLLGSYPGWEPPATARPLLEAPTGSVDLAGWPGALDQALAGMTP